MGFDLGSKMSEITEITEITLNCLIVPFGRLHGLLLDRVTPRVTVRRSQTVSALEVAIQRELVAPYNTVRLSFYKTPDMTPMQPQDLISKFFDEEPRDDYCHIIVHPLSE
ncbi:hypothetical protein C1646_774242 [Rhizophagus diaphanus]|nr:hypothetical protein C1646_774242 [Rhizophagus diaphanus] [Rhizophagus sp. MUCL 43196]